MKLQTNVKHLICYTIGFIECKSRAPLGMSTGYILSNQLKAESSKDGKSQPSQARLHLAETSWQCDRFWYTGECWFQVCLISLDLTIINISSECVACKYNPITHTF